jgi:hypothetical protein
MPLTVRCYKAVSAGYISCGVEDQTGPDTSRSEVLGRGWAPTGGGQCNL